MTLPALASGAALVVCSRGGRYVELAGARRGLAVAGATAVVVAGLIAHAGNRALASGWDALRGVRPGAPPTTHDGHGRAAVVGRTLGPARRCAAGGRSRCPGAGGVPRGDGSRSRFVGSVAGARGRGSLEQRPPSRAGACPQPALQRPRRTRNRPSNTFLTLCGYPVSDTERVRVVDGPSPSTTRGELPVKRITAGRPRRIAFVAVATVASAVMLASLGGISVAQGVIGLAQYAYGKEKVVLCHKGKNTIRVGKPAVAAHLRHGDVVGTCAQARKAAKLKAAKLKAAKQAAAARKAAKLAAKQQKSAAKKQTALVLIAQTGSTGKVVGNGKSTNGKSNGAGKSAGGKGNGKKYGLGWARSQRPGPPITLELDLVVAYVTNAYGIPVSETCDSRLVSTKTSVSKSGNARHRRRPGRSRSAAARRRTAARRRRSAPRRSRTPAARWRAARAPLRASRRARRPRPSRPRCA